MFTKLFLFFIISFCSRTVNPTRNSSFRLNLFELIGVPHSRPKLVSVPFGWGSWKLKFDKVYPSTAEESAAYEAWLYNCGQVRTPVLANNFS